MPCPEVPFFFVLLAVFGAVCLAAFLLWLAGWAAWLWYTRDMKVTHIGQINRRLFR